MSHWNMNSLFIGATTTTVAQKYTTINNTTIKYTLWLHTTTSNIVAVSD